MANLVVGLQEYGVTNRSLIAGLEARGAIVERVHVYDWDLPEDCGPLEANHPANRRRRDRRRHVHLRPAGAQSARSWPTTWASPTNCAPASAIWSSPRSARPPAKCSATNDLPVDMEPSHPKMGHLVQEAAEQAGGACSAASGSSSSIRNPQSAIRNPADAPWHDSPFLRACRREPRDYTPVWLMRQAGRYMPEYRAIREQMSFLELCRNPQLCSEIMCTAVEQLGVDAAIVFSDLLPILEPMGMELEFAHGEGPLIHNPVRESADVDRVIELEDADALHFVMEAVRQTRADLPAHIPLIGFAGAPFTLASYAIEGGASRNYLHTKTLMYRDAGAWHELMERLARAVVVYLNAQIAAGAQAVQLFDSWVGCLGADDYRQYVLPYVTQVIGGITPGVPVINFATGNPQLLPLLAEAGAAVDRRRLARAARRCLANDRPRPRDPRQSRSDGAAGRRSRAPPPRDRQSSTKPPAAPATSSTSATASCRKRPSTTPARWSTSCTNTAHVGKN